MYGVRAWYENSLQNFPHTTGKINLAVRDVCVLAAAFGVQIRNSQLGSFLSFSLLYFIAPWALFSKGLWVRPNVVGSADVLSEHWRTLRTSRGIPFSGSVSGAVNVIFEEHHLNNNDNLLLSKCSSYENERLNGYQKNSLSRVGRKAFPPWKSHLIWNIFKECTGVCW